MTVAARDGTGARVGVLVETRSGMGMPNAAGSVVETSGTVADVGKSTSSSPAGCTVGMIVGSKSSCGDGVDGTFVASKGLLGLVEGRGPRVGNDDGNGDGDSFKEGATAVLGWTAVGAVATGATVATTTFTAESLSLLVTYSVTKTVTPTAIKRSETTTATATVATVQSRRDHRDGSDDVVGVVLLAFLVSAAVEPPRLVRPFSSAS